MKMRVVPFILLIVCGLSACVSVQPRIEGSTQGVELGKLQSWRANGRIGVAAAQTGGSGSFNWEQQGAQSSVQLAGPVGIGSVQLHLNGDAIEVATGDGQTYHAQAALDELQARLGAVIPPAKLRYWLLGLAAPGQYRWLDDNMTQLEQDGWRIEYGEFLMQDGVRLPAKITASSGTTRVRILVERWQLG